MRKLLADLSLDKGGYHLNYFSLYDFETLWNYKMFHNDSLLFKSQEEYS